jgi:outer membrane immunogenic protein
MNKFLTGAIAAIAAAVAVPALAADLPPRTYAPAPIAVPRMIYNWSGCYIGGNVGGGWARNALSVTGNVLGVPVGPGADLGSNEGSSVIGGGQIGCDHQLGNWVIGAQGMFDFGNIDRSHGIVTFPGLFADNKVKDMFTVTGRIGYLFAPQVLAYFKGGGAWAKSSQFVTNAVGVGLESDSNNRTGWTVGGGLEWMFAPGWSVFGEYNYMNFGTRAVAVPVVVGAAAVFSTELTIQQALVGVNYKFNWGGPVVGGY